MLVWADGEPGQNQTNRDLHVNFQLSGDGEAIVLYAPDGTVVDMVVFGPQLQDISEGRWPETSFETCQMAIPTPKGSNVLMSVTKAEMLTNAVLQLRWNTRAGRQYRVQYSSTLKTSVWNAIGGDIPVSESTFTTNVDISVPGPRFYRIRQLP
jgi:hypothetical protein